MYELWARRRATKRYEFIVSFDNEEQKYYLIDCLDTSVYYEAMILQNQRCNMYCEFEKPLCRRLKK